MKDINILQDEIIKSDIKNAEKIWKDAEGDNSLERLYKVIILISLLYFQ